VLLPSVAVLPWDEHGRVLLVREAETGLWQTIGGAVEPDESPAQAAVREAAGAFSTRYFLARQHDRPSVPARAIEFDAGCLARFGALNAAARGA